MEKNFSDGLEYLVKCHMSIADSKELLKGNEPIHKAFNGLVDEAIKKCVSFSNFNEVLQEKASLLEKEILKAYRKLGQTRETSYQRYVGYRDILSLCMLCPYIIPRQTMFEIFHKGMREQLY